MLRNDGSSKGFGFVDFGSPEEAETAIADLHGKQNPRGKVRTRDPVSTK